MTEKHIPIRALIDTWPTRKVLAETIGANVEAVHKWAAAGRIPSRWHASVIAAARKQGIEYATAEWMAAQHARL